VLIRHHKPVVWFQICTIPTFGAAYVQWDGASFLKYFGARIEIGEGSSERFGQADLRFTSGWGGRHPRKHPWSSFRQAWDRSNEQSLGRFQTWNDAIARPFSGWTCGWSTKALICCILDSRANHPQAWWHEGKKTGLGMAAEMDCGMNVRQIAG